MHELYLWPFADSVRAGVASVMCSYNQVNNTYACGNSKTINGLLKDELGFQVNLPHDPGRRLGRLKPGARASSNRIGTPCVTGFPPHLEDST